MIFTLLTLPSPGGQRNIESQSGRWLEGRLGTHNEWNNLLLKVTKAEPLNNLQIIFPESLVQPVNKFITKPKVHAGRFRARLTKI